MKVVFRTYTKKDGSPEYGVYAVLEHLNGLKEKDVLVRIDVDKANELGFDEVDIYCPSPKISHLELRKFDDRKFEASFDVKHKREVFQILLNIGMAANPGHSFEMMIGKEHFYIDGDGADYIESINGRELNSKLYSDKYEWSKVYNKEDDDMKETVNLNESQLRKVISECVKSVLQEIGDTEKGQFLLGKLSQRQMNRGEEDAASAYARETRQNLHKNAYTEKERNKANRMDSAFLKGREKQGKKTE